MHIYICRETEMFLQAEIIDHVTTEQIIIIWKTQSGTMW